MRGWLSGGDEVIKPPLEELLEQVDNKYALVIIAAKRAQQLKEGVLPLVDIDSANPVSIALEEIATGKVRYEEPQAVGR
ncbi:MAG: DNA-directed RNA polymerase subunit omega [Armatimonadetes bacterium]|nr:DNA-directed RNA polymerase subunit omega [Armatimonadota bacterium]